MLQVRNIIFYISLLLMILFSCRCSTTNPLYNPRGGNRCNNCGQPFVHSFVSFEILPLVEFQLDEGISDKEAMMLIESSSSKSNDKPVKEDILTMDDSSSDPFGQKLFSLVKPVLFNIFWCWWWRVSYKRLLC